MFVENWECLSNFKEGFEIENRSSLGKGRRLISPFQTAIEVDSESRELVENAGLSRGNLNT